MAAKARPPAEDLVDIDIKPSDLELFRLHMIGRIRTSIMEVAYNSEPGRVAQAMSDLRALQWLNPAREEDGTRRMPEAPRSFEEDATIIQAEAKRAEKRAQAERVE